MDAQDLAASILAAATSSQIAAATSSQIAAACSTVDAFLRRHAWDQFRAFFTITFPALLYRLFGFDDSPLRPSPSSSSSAWIHCASADPDLAAALYDLLSPQGILISSIFSVDGNAFVKYVFPLERLPEWMRLALQSDIPSSPICPLFSRSGSERT